MARTFNRKPVQVDTPDSDDIKNYFFNHYNWKGLSDSKNALTVDQETFSDCNNVYVDSEGLLRSRPSLKIRIVKYKTEEQEFVLSDIVDVWNFGDVTVYESVLDGEYYLTFVNKNVEEHIQVKLNYFDNQGVECSYKEIRPILADNKIFIFSKHAFNYYDIEENIYANAEEFIYVPNTNAIYETEIKHPESANILTNSYIKTYLYEYGSTANFDALVGKELTVTIDGNTYKVNFVYNNELVFVKRFCALSEKNFADDYILGAGAKGIPLVQVSESGSMLVCSYDYTLDANKNPTIKWKIYHTVTGVDFTELVVPEGIVGQPLISRDGIYAIVFLKDGPYGYCVLESSEGGYKFMGWQNLLKRIDEDKYDELFGEDFDIAPKNESAINFNQSVQVNGYFIDDTTFAFTYADNLVDNIDIKYNNFYCVYADESSFYKQSIFNAAKTELYVENFNTVADNTAIEKFIRFSESSERKTEQTSDDTIYHIIYRYTGLYTGLYSDSISFYIKGNQSSTLQLQITNLKITYTRDIYSSQNYGEVNEIWNPAEISYCLKIVLNKEDGTSTTIFDDITIQYSDGAYNPDEGGAGSAHTRTLALDKYLCFQTSYVTDWKNCILQIWPNTQITYTKTIAEGGTKLPTAQYTESEAMTANYMPAIQAAFENKQLQIAVRFVANVYENSRSVARDYICHIEPTNSVFKTICIDRNYYYIDNDEKNANYMRVPLRNSCIITDNKYVFTINKYYEKNYFKRFEYSIIIHESNDTDIKVISAKPIYTKSSLFSSYNEFKTQRLILSDRSKYLLTNDLLFPYTDYSEYGTYTPIPLIVTGTPVAYFYSGNSKDSLYIATSANLYTNAYDIVIELSETIKGETNYILPDANSLLENYYFAEGNKLYISNSVNNEPGKFKWYFPEIRKQTFEKNIVNLHPISTTEMAIFFDDSIWYSSFDAESSVGYESGIYRYYKSKLQAGCKKGSDILTTFDGNYTIFASDRGLAALSYQNFVASTEQSLTYLSDTIYTTFINYITEAKSTNQIKLFKFGYWILIYKQDSKSGLIYDTRTSSWWPITGIDNITKIITIDNEVQLLISGKMYFLNKLDTNYFDNTEKEHKKIDWFIKSQKLHLNAINNYKHIVNMTFVSVHDSNALENTEYNINEIYFKLQANCYRKKIVGNINNNDDFVNINYNVETLRTFVQRVNYSKVNEFQYQLSSDAENAIDIPLSLNSITIKYKVGGQVR